MRGAAMIKFLVILGGLYIIYKLLTRPPGKRVTLNEEASRAVIALTRTTRWVLIAILLLIGVALAHYLYDIYQAWR